MVGARHSKNSVGLLHMLLGLSYSSKTFFFGTAEQQDMMAFFCAGPDSIIHLPRSHVSKYIILLRTD